MSAGWLNILLKAVPGLSSGNRPDAPSALRAGRSAIAARHGEGVCAGPAVRAAQLPAGNKSKALALLTILLCLFPGQAPCANNGDKIVNRATLTTLEYPATSASVTVTAMARTKSSVEFFKYAPGFAGATGIPVARTSYLNASGSLIPMPAPLAVGTQAPIDLSVPVPLIATSTYHESEPLFVQLTDLDQNLDSTQAETVLVTVSDPTSGDSETLQLTETGPDTGVFIGYIQTASSSTVLKNGTLSVAESSPITAQYTDSADPSDSSSTTVLVDPFGFIFDSTTGKPVDGAKVELLNADGTPAKVLGDDGLSSNSFPNTVLSGGTASDNEGRIYAFNPGGYRFPFVAPGNYLLRVTPPAGYSSPSTVSTTKIQALSGGPFAIGDGSFGKVFSVPTGPAIRVDIPIDPKSGTLWLSKVAGQGITSAGEYLSYDITLENTDTVATAFFAVVSDRLPPGFRYQKGTARLNGTAVADPAISADGSTLSFALGDVAPKTSALLHYVTAVGAGAKPGDAVNTATASATPAVSSNTASASVTVQEPFMQSRSLIMGRVVVGACSESAEDNKKGMEGVGIFLEDGTFVITDKRGMFHLEGVAAGTHVVQLDLDSIPEGYQILPCEQNSRFAGRAYSQFVDLQGGTMWRADFHLGRTGLIPPAADSIPLKSVVSGNGVTTGATGSTSPTGPTGAISAVPAEGAAGAGYQGEVSVEMISSQDGDFINYSIPMQAGSAPLKNLFLSVTLPEGAIYQKGSSKLDGAAIPDPEVGGGKLGYRLGSAGAGWQKDLRFRISMDRKAKGGELQTKADLTFDGPTAQRVAAPQVDNTLSLIKEEKRISLPPIVLHPHFQTFSADLEPEDRQQLDELALVLSRFKIDRIAATGHTDIVRIAPRSRNIYANNNALSFARARSIGRYLTAALHLPPESLELSGKGEREPISTNKTVPGRALNRRVELNVSLSQEVETSRLKIVKDRSGLKKHQIAGARTAASVPGAGQLSKIQASEETMVLQGAAHATDAALPAGSSDEKARSIASNPPQGASAVQVGTATVPVPNAASVKSAAPVKSEAAAKSTAPIKNEPQVQLISAQSEGVLHYRIKLVGYQGPLKGVSATLVTPKSHLYMTGTSTLSGLAAADPQTKESVISYTFAALPDDKKFDLRLQAVVDGDDQAEAQRSSVTVVIAGSAGKPAKTFSAAAELSDNMDEINKPDLPPVEAPAVQTKSLKEEADQNSEFAEQVPRKAGSANTQAAPDSALHVRDHEGIQYPADGTITASRINAVRIVLNSGLTPLLTLDGKEIPAERVGFRLKDQESEKSLYTYIGVDFGVAGDHTLQLKGMDGFGVARFTSSAKVIRTGEIASLKLVSAEGNIADGKTPVKVRVQLFDKDNKPVRANAELSLKGGNLRPVSSDNPARDAGTSLVAVDAEGWITFQPVSASGLYRVQLAYNKAILEVETYVKPKMRNWILVGLAEGTAGYNTASGHLDNLKASGEDDKFYDRERVAFYAKGTIKGEWLLTMSYDSAKKSTGVSGNALFQNIDPNAFYTMYGDASAQGYDASSQKKLYLKVESDQFYALYGDYDTGLSVTELSRYSRRMNGAKAEFRSKNYEATVFGSETGQSFVKDEILGDGTSGLYRLSRPGIVINSENITIQTRDRFHSEIVTDTHQMTRFIDYSIDYDAGTIFFKGPVASKDDQLNPVYIVVDYEVANAGSNALTYGGRAGTKMLDGKLQVGGTFVHEGQVNGSNNLYGADAAVALGPGTKLRAEFAGSRTDSGLVKSSGNAYLAEILHTGKDLDGKAYYREQDSGFGLGQQAGSETGTRKFGAEGAYRLSSDTTLNAQAYQQDNQAGGNVRDFAELLENYNDKERGLSTRAGARYASDSLADGSHATSLLGTVGVSWKTLNQRLTLRADHDQALFSNNKNTDFPTRTVLGADFQATKSVTLFAQEELTFGSAARTDTTRVGVKATPWSGGTVSSSVGNDMTENRERTFATVGLAQKWQLTPRWTVDGGLDRNQTIRNKTNSSYQFDANVPPASGGEDFTAVSLGANFQEKKLAWSNRVEYRTSSTDNKWGLITGVMNEQGLYWGWTGKLQVLHSHSDGGTTSTDADLRVGIAYRPPVTRWILLDRLDLVSNDDSSASSSTRGKRIINNMNANFKPNQRTQLSLQYGAKYVLQQIDDTDYSGYTDLLGVEGRYDLATDWDIGLRGSILHTWELQQFSYSLGTSVGYNLMENAWLSLGYNLIGFKDRDFSAASFTAQGPFVQFRVKFDQNSVKDGLKVLNQ